MYIIVRNNKRFSKKTFSSYEEARSYARKTIRRFLSMLGLKAKMGDESAVKYHNPAINMYGYSVVAR
jgi:hypothetical protein